MYFLTTQSSKGACSQAYECRRSCRRSLNKETNEYQPGIRLNYICYIWALCKIVQNYDLGKNCFIPISYIFWLDMFMPPVARLQELTENFLNKTRIEPNPHQKSVSTANNFF